MVNVRRYAEGKYLKVEHVKNSENKIAVIVGQSEKKGTFGMQFELDIQFNKIPKTWSPNSLSVANIISVYGEEANDWIGKKIKLYIDETSSGKEIIMAEPVVDIVSADKIEETSTDIKEPGKEEN